MANATKTPLRVGFIGLGIMGQPMATNILRVGFPLTVWNRTAAKMAPLTALGAHPADSPAALASHCDVVITMVTGPADLEEVVLGERGVIEGAAPGSVLIDMSTMGPTMVRAVAAKLAEKGVDMLDAPVSGGERGAIAGSLVIMVGGPVDILDRCRPILSALGPTIIHCGPIGAGQTVKLCNQVAVALNNLAMCEALVLAAKAGVDPATMIEAVSAGAGASWSISNLAPRILAGDYQPGFRAAHQLKDLRLALDLAQEAGLPLPGSALVSELYSALMAAGQGEEGSQALVKVLEQLGNVGVRKSPLP